MRNLPSDIDVDDSYLRLVGLGIEECWNCDGTGLVRSVPNNLVCPVCDGKKKCWQQLK